MNGGVNVMLSLFIQCDPPVWINNIECFLVSVNAQITKPFASHNLPFLHCVFMTEDTYLLPLALIIANIWYRTYRPHQYIGLLLVWLRHYVFNTDEQYLHIY